MDSSFVSNYFSSVMLIGTIIWIMIGGIIWGSFAIFVGRQKNIYGFWWGFWLGPIGVLVVAAMKPRDQMFNIQS